MKHLRNLIRCSPYLTICLVLLPVSQLSAQDGDGPAAEREKTVHRALIVDGQNNHRVWPKTTQMMRRYLEETGMFIVDVATTQPEGTDPDYKPQFSDYAVVISNYNGSPWPNETKTALDEYMKNGGGLVIVHAADNSFPGWREFNEMIGLGGWGGRNEESGPYVYFNDQGEEVRDESAGGGGGHGPQHPFAVVIRNDSHPITAGLPAGFMHAKDELYERLRGPAANMTVLATAYADPEQRGTARHEPMAMTIEYGEGRVFHTPMGHADYSMECTGFITMFQRGTEWAATGEVTQEVPEDFPNSEDVTQRTFVEQDEASMELAAAIEKMIEICQTGTGEEIVNAIAHPEDLKEIKERGELEEVYRELGERKKDRLLAALLSIPRSLIKVEGDACDLGGRPNMTFEKYDGSWYLRN